MNKVFNENCLLTMDFLDAESVDLTVTSPPYDNLRDYNGYSFDFEAVAQGLFRITKKGGIVVWVVNDAVIKGSESGTSFQQALFFKSIGFNLHDTMIFLKNSPAYPAGEKSNRYGQTFEYMFVFSKGSPKTSNLIKDKPNRWAGYHNFAAPTSRMKNGELKERKKKNIVADVGYRYNVWQYATGAGTADKIAFEHPATFPYKLAEDHISTWSNPGELIYDPFSGSGTTLIAAFTKGRNYIGSEISSKYCDLIDRRLSALNGYASL